VLFYFFIILRCATLHISLRKTKNATKIKKVPKKMKILNKQKKLNSKGFGHIEILLAIVVLVGIVGAGVFVYARQHKAHAGSFTYLGVRSNINMYVCKTYVNAYGGVYQVTAQFTKAASSTPLTYRLYVQRPPAYTTISDTQNNAYLFGTVAQLKANASVYNGDAATLGVQDPTRPGFDIFTIGGKYGGKQWSQIANC
jgi:hypothetical protein